MLLALGLIILALMVLFNFIQPAYTSVQALKGQLAGQQSLLSTEKQAIDQANQLLATFQNQSDAEQAIALAMPGQPDVAGALSQIYGIGQNAGLVIKTMNVSSPTLQKSAPAASGGSTPSGGVNLIKPIGNMTFTVSAQGTYEAFKTFVRGIETNIRIFDIANFTIAPYTQQASFAGAKGFPASSGRDFFSYTMVIAVHYQTM